METKNAFAPAFTTLYTAAKEFAALHPAHNFTVEESRGSVVDMQGVRCQTLTLILTSDLPGHEPSVFKQTRWADGDATDITHNGFHWSAAA